MSDTTTPNPWIPVEEQEVHFSPLWANNNQRAIVELFEKEGLDTEILQFNPVKHLSIDINKWKHEDGRRAMYYIAKDRDSGLQTEGEYEYVEDFYEAMREMIIALQLAEYDKH
jgi:hypothetical protein